MMAYIRVSWRHEFIEEPVDLWSELDSDRFEVRKLEIYRDGRVSYASAVEYSGDTRLGVEPIPSVQDINRDPQFVAREVNKGDFDRVWEARHEAES